MLTKMKSWKIIISSRYKSIKEMENMKIFLHYYILSSYISLYSSVLLYVYLFLLSYEHHWFLHLLYKGERERERCISFIERERGKGRSRWRTLFFSRRKQNIPFLQLLFNLFSRLFSSVFNVIF